MLVPKSYLIRNAKLIETDHKLHLKKVDVLVTSGVIQAIGANLQSADAAVIEGKELVVTNGWVDMRCHLTDPGNEHKDTLQNLMDTAASGGFTKLVTLPNSEPAIADKSGVKYLQQASQYHLVDLKPTGVLSSTERENLAELYDMYGAGAIAFTNGDASVSNGLLKKALLYTKPFGARIITHPSDKSLEQHGLVNESANTLHTGLKTSSSLAEYLNVQEQIEVAKYCDAALHFSAISAAESVDLIRRAKKEGLKITCDVAIANLCFTDEEVLSFEENFKLYPPLRTEKDRQALIAGVNDGTIDAICSNHCPQNIENKEVEFDYADFGALSLQMVYAWYTKYLQKDLALSKFVEKLTTGPNTCLQEKASTLEVGQEANITVLDQATNWVFDASTNHSVSKNTHEWNKELNGKVVAVFNNKQVIINI